VFSTSHASCGATSPEHRNVSAEKHLPASGGRGHGACAAPEQNPAHSSHVAPRYARASNFSGNPTHESGLGTTAHIPKSLWILRCEECLEQGLGRPDKRHGTLLPPSRACDEARRLVETRVNRPIRAFVHSCDTSMHKRAAPARSGERHDERREQRCTVSSVKHSVGIAHWQPFHAACRCTRRAASSRCRSASASARSARQAPLSARRPSTPPPPSARSSEASYEADPARARLAPRGGRQGGFLPPRQEGRGEPRMSHAQSSRAATSSAPTATRTAVSLRYCHARRCASTARIDRAHRPRASTARA
jgi:hypothetical protein